MQKRHCSWPLRMICTGFWTGAASSSITLTAAVGRSIIKKRAPSTRTGNIFGSTTPGSLSMRWARRWGRQYGWWVWFRHSIYVPFYSNADKQGMRYLINKHSLDKQPRENVPVYIEDMVPFNETILQTREKWFYLGFQQIILCLYNTIGLFTINRKHTILNIQFKHLQLTL